MFKPKESDQIKYEFISIDQLVYADHLLRVIDKFIDFSFLLEKIRPYYSEDNGRPTVPLILFKMMFTLTAACQNLKKITTHLARSVKVCCNSLGRVASC